MTSATQPARGTSGRHAEGQGYGLVFFASVLMVIIGFFNLIYGIAAIANSHVFTANAHYVFGSLRTWGWITLIIGVLQLAAAAGVLAGNQLARWFAVAVLGLSAIDQMFFVPAYPFWSLTIIAMDVVALYGLCAYGSRANLAASRSDANRAGGSMNDQRQPWNDWTVVLRRRPVTRHGLAWQRLRRLGPGSMSSQAAHVETTRHGLTLVERR